MEVIHGYELITEWKNSQCGKIAKAQKGRNVYIIKKYQTPVEPVLNGALDERTFNSNKQKFEKFVALRRKVNSALRTITGDGGNIISPKEEFIDEHHYVEVAEWVEGAVSDDDLDGVLTGLSFDVKKLLMLTAAGALASVHKLGIIHSDLKLKNVLLAKNKTKNYVAKLIDFDSSYFIDDIPEEVVGDINFYSPELGAYSVADEDDKEELAKYLTEKSDIFSLGLIFHRYLSGEMPTAQSLNSVLQKRKDRGKTIYCWSILNGGCELALSNKIKNLGYRCLIQDMLSLDPVARPKAIDVLQRLKEPDIVETYESSWPEHNITINIDKLKSNGFIVLKKVNQAGRKVYLLIDQEGKKAFKSKDDLVSEGFARISREARFCETWAEHAIKFDETKLRQRGFVASEQKEMSGVKGYEMFRSDDSSQFFTVGNLIAMKYAVEVTPIVVEGFCKPWDEHKINFDIDKIKKRGYVHSEQKILSGKKGYEFVKADGTSQFIKLEMLLILGMATNSR